MVFKVWIKIKNEELIYEYDLYDLNQWFSNSNLDFIVKYKCGIISSC